ncbi:hypothetical protein BKA70DRAFT_1224408 [Coprinopsis sp. MPI-PUGE-AT-0042]|nr:hypothetical protein BKA70DRAFT_1224408 [Coprinopsis sp. MPI-PUGE-AT-0042]
MASTQVGDSSRYWRDSNSLFSERRGSRIVTISFGDKKSWAEIENFLQGIEDRGKPDMLDTPSMRRVWPCRIKEHFDNPLPAVRELRGVPSAKRVKSDNGAQGISYMLKACICDATEIGYFLLRLQLSGAVKVSAFPHD